MRRQGLQGRPPKRRRGLTKQDKSAPVFADLLRRDFTAAAPNQKWCGDITEIPTDEGKLYLASVLDLCGRRLLACPMSEHPDAELTSAAIKMAAAVRGGRGVIDQVIFHPTADQPIQPQISLHCAGGWGSANRWAGSGRASISRQRGILLHAGTRSPVPASVCHQGPGPRCRDRLVPRFLQPTAPTQLAGLLPPVEYEKIAAIQPGAARGSLHDSGGSPTPASAGRPSQSSSGRDSCCCGVRDGTGVQERMGGGLVGAAGDVAGRSSENWVWVKLAVMVAGADMPVVGFGHGQRPVEEPGPETRA